MVFVEPHRHVVMPYTVVQSTLCVLLGTVIINYGWAAFIATPFSPIPATEMVQGETCPRGLDYYGVLGLTKNATTLEIKEAYRRLAMQYNPERQGDPSLHDLFALIGEAYEVLSSSLLKAIYDQYGEAGLKKGVVTPYGYNPPYVYHGEPLTTFKNFFGSANPYADLTMSLEKPPKIFDFNEGKGVKRKEKPYIRPLALKLDEVYHGGLKIIKILRKVFRDDAFDATSKEEKLLNIPIPPGIPPGTQLTFPECGDQGPSIIPGDIIFVVEDKPHPVFRREGVDLIMKATISIQEALTGSVITINTLDDRTLRVAITQIVTPDYEKVVQDEGMPYPDDKTKRGNLIIKFNVNYPTKLSPISKKMINRAFMLSAAEDEKTRGESKLPPTVGVTIKEGPNISIIPVPPSDKPYIPEIPKIKPAVVKPEPKMLPVVQAPPLRTMASLANKNAVALPPLPTPSPI